MTAISLPLPGNALHEESQTLEFDKIATFIGGNGSGKSTILKSIFEDKLAGKEYHDYKVVCFSSGQNESYSNGFSKHLSSERKNKNALSLDCFYYDKLWSKLLIFMATTSRHNGLVRSFLRQHKYVVENKLDVDESTKLSFKIKVDKSYTNLVKQSLEDESNGESDVITNKAYHRTLYNFINSLVNDGYEFDEPIEQQEVQLNQDRLSSVSFEADENASFDSKVMFFTQAADNDYFIVKNSVDIEFLKVAEAKNEENKVLQLEDLSDGEYQLLFLYALVDLFDTAKTLFLLDEADSHLHFKNIDKLWSVFESAEGSIITTTHLLDSITKAGIDRLKVIVDGQVKPGNNLKYLTSRLRELSEINNVKFQALSLFENIVLIDDENDWIQFKLLAIKKLANTAEDKKKMESVLGSFIAVKCHSGYEGKKNEVFAGKKLLWLDNFIEYLNGHSHNTKNVFLICDRDELQLTNIGTEKCSLLVQGESGSRVKQNPTSHLLCWKRREIKHYLLSHTALIDDIDEINERFDLSDKSKIRAGNTSDYKVDGCYNDRIASQASDPVKEIVDPHINIEGKGFCIDKARAYVASMPKEEISEDIADMYNYLVSTNE